MRLSALALAYGLVVSGAARAVTPSDLKDAIARLKRDDATRGTWKLLESIGWKIKLTDRSADPVRIVGGHPLELESFATLKAEDCKHLCITVDKNLKGGPDRVANAIAEALPRALENPASQDAHRLKIASLAQTAALEIGKAFKWPDADVDALGKGFKKYFLKHELTEDDIQRYDMANVPKRERHDYASWVKRPEFKSSEAIESLVDVCKPKSSGCQVALGSVITRMLQLSYDDTKTFDAHFEDITINNALFRKSTLLPSVKTDETGKTKIAQGRHALIGEGAYITSIFNADVDDPNYAGENVLITGMSDNALADLKKMKSFGHADHTDDELFELEDDTLSARQLEEAKAAALEKYKGVSKEMVRYWGLTRDLAHDAHLKPAELASILRNETPAKFAGKNLVTYQKIRAILDRPFFQETILWGHPAGEQTLAEWMIYLPEINPRTPYSMFLYDYGHQTVQWESYKQAHLALNKPKAHGRAANCLEAIGDITGH